MTFVWSFLLFSNDFGPTFRPSVLHSAMAIDATIIKLFGEPPDDLDLLEVSMWRSEWGLIALICIAIVSVILRYAARTVQKAGFRADDYFMILGLVCFSSPYGVAQLSSDRQTSDSNLLPVAFSRHLHYCLKG